MGRRQAVAGAAFFTCALSVATGCGSSPHQGGADSIAPTVSACQLLTVSTIERVTHRTLAPGELAVRHARDWSICNWEDLRIGVAVQVQVRRGHADETLAERRRTLGQLGRQAPSRVTVAGADAAYAVADYGVLVMAVGDDFLQLSTLGNAVDARQRLTLAASAVQAAAA